MNNILQFVFNSLTVVGGYIIVLALVGHDIGYILNSLAILAFVIAMLYNAGVWVAKFLHRNPAHKE